MQQTQQIQIARYANRLVPRIRKSCFEPEATRFLKKYCPEALVTPMAVPIEHIITEKMGLTIRQARLTEDFSVFAQICFTSGVAEIYDKESDGYEEILVKAGTIIIDPDTLKRRNLGCMNNTLAHESVHWEKHRQYHEFLSQYSNFHCSAVPNETQQSNWTDEDWMEWQANGIAPRILMPIQTIRTAFHTFCEQYDFYRKNPDTSNESDINEVFKISSVRLTQKFEWVRQQTAALYKVSKQSAGIRFEELKLVPKGTFDRA